MACGAAGRLPGFAGKRIGLVHLRAAERGGSWRAPLGAPHLIGLHLKQHQWAGRGLAHQSEPALEKAGGLDAHLEVLQDLESFGLHLPFPLCGKIHMAQR